MKLAVKYNRVTLMVSFIVLIFTGLVYYTVIHFILTDQLDKDLTIEEEEIISYTKTFKKLPLPASFKDQKVVYKIVDPGNIIEREFFNTDFYNISENQSEPGRGLKTSHNVNGKLYEITITKSRVEAEDLVRIIFIITLGVTALLLLTLMLINRFLLNNLWKPFYAVLEQMKAFNLADKNDIVADQTKIDEFSELNQAVIAMALRVKQDYKELKTFTDNASHEMMTPLAVINSKLDTLIQTGAFTDQQGQLIEDVYLGVNRLSRLNQSLLLLAKIENNLISDQENINLKELLEQKIRQFKDLINSCQLVLTMQLDHKELVMNRYLADILMNNLLGNAIRHNYPGGEINVCLTAQELCMTNTCNTEELIADKAFERFYKNTASEGMGLGLAISKQICALYHFKLNYQYKEARHAFIIVF